MTEEGEAAVEVDEEGRADEVAATSTTEDARVATTEAARHAPERPANLPHATVLGLVPVVATTIVGEHATRVGEMLLETASEAAQTAGEIATGTATATASVTVIETVLVIATVIATVDATARAIARRATRMLVVIDESVIEVVRGRETATLANAEVATKARTAQALLLAANHASEGARHVCSELKYLSRAFSLVRRPDLHSPELDLLPKPQLGLQLV